MKTNDSPTNFPTITKTYARLGFKDLGVELNNYVQGLTNNPRFTAISTQIDEYAGTVSNYTMLQAKAATTRDKNVLNDRDTARTAAILATINISNAVAEIAKGDLAALDSTNLPLRKAKTPYTPGGPGNFTLSASDIAGQLDVKMKNIKGKFILLARYAMSPLGDKPVWTQVMSTVTKFSITGLQSGERYFVQLGITVKGNVTIWGDALLSPYIKSADVS